MSGLQHPAGQSSDALWHVHVYSLTAAAASSTTSRSSTQAASCQQARQPVHVHTCATEAVVQPALDQRSALS
jgi:hypothetical protein